ncbi:hypothetical protein N5923_23550 [Erwiniaceae bacterium BAC15a-03b]|uniref:Uncharacterized protein n=1 Tax=Winslowiella arboricola TaxID=2978220 RepID=A0A9J6PYE0_9GAMM|nr:hypothetical protein [Winslowiella arboricola]MCU5775074.1 hypothetical protein [Winslowiella arboricola]MCU5780472.1 hypothetical protein [Winslowiella arboricola]
MTLEDTEADACFISLMAAVIEPMTFELAQQEANADHRTEQQDMMMGGFYEGL